MFSIKIKKPVMFSIGISVAAHILFFSCATTIEVPGAYNVLDRTKQFFNLKAVRQEIDTKKPLRKRTVTYVQAIKFESPTDPDSLKAILEAEKEFIEKMNLKTQPEKAKDISRISEMKDLKVQEEKIVKEVDQRKTRADLVDVGLDDKDRVLSSKEITIPEHFFEKMPGFTPQGAKGTMESIKGKLASFLSQRDISLITRDTDFTDLEGYLVYALSTYEDPDDGQKYYEISIRTGRGASQLKGMPKEIVFLIDCSLSIQPERLEQFKKGLHYSLKHLNPGDLFNIIAFKEKMIWFSPQSIEPSDATIHEALRFVKQLTAGEGTDTYNALYESIKVPKTITPSYIMLFSDGRPTYGVTNSRKIINEISKINTGKRPIFAFSGGMRVNRYFLDFISYKNRGWTEYASRTHMIGKNVARMYEKIKDPLFLNLRYRISGLDGSRMFPKTLSDFYRNAEFKLYGKYTNEDKFSLQLLGDTQTETNEFIIAGSLKDVFKGDETIARNWAFNKIYYLIGLLEAGVVNEEIIKEIDTLCEKFDITTPYSESIQD